MRPSMFQTQLESGATRCDVCQWRCELLPNQVGRCRVRRNIDGVVQAEADELISAAKIVPIEDLRMWHFFPDAPTFTVGSFGTPLLKQQQGPHATLPPAEQQRAISGERIANTAIQRLCRGIAWTYNDPAVSLEWLSDGLKLARANSRFALMTSSGFSTPEAVQALGPDLDGFRLDLLGFSDNAYTSLGGVEEWRGILATAEKLRAHWNVHIEVTLTLHRAVNDDEDQIRNLAAWMMRTLGSLTPLHLLVPAKVDPAVAVNPAKVARETGLKFVYGPEDNQVTRCPNCTWVVIQRQDGPTELPGVIGDSCESCGTPLGLRLSIFNRKTKYEVDE